MKLMFVWVFIDQLLAHFDFYYERRDERRKEK